MAGYHLGFLDERGRPSEANGGKALRPALAFLSAQAAGATTEVGLLGAASVELIHNFSLIHDDVMDRDVQRRHRPAAWTLFGDALAILAGDLLLVLGLRLLVASPSPARSEAAVALTQATARMAEGQAMDLSFESRLDITPQECLVLSELKTGSLLSCAASIGAVLAGAGPELVRALAEYGLQLGVAYQATDDLLGIWGSAKVTGKPAMSDLRRRKMTLPVAEALSETGPGPKRLRRLLSRGTLSEEQLRLAAQLVEVCGGRDRTMAEAERRISAALRSLDRVPLGVRVRRQLDELGAFVLTRDS